MKPTYIWVYYTCLLVCGICALVINLRKPQYSLLEATGSTKQRRPGVVYVLTFVMMGYLIFWAAIRNGVVDTAGYVRSYIEMGTEFNWSYLFESGQEKAPLFEVFQIILKRLGFTWHMYIATIAIISGVCFYYGISRYSDDVVLSFYLFMTGLYFYWLFNGIRQFLVASIVFACWRLIIEKKLVKFLILIFIMYFIHKTAWILVPIYFIVHMKNWSYGIYACILATMAVVLIFPNQFVGILDDTYTEYNVAENFAKDDGVNVFRFLVSMVTPALAFVFKKEIAAYENRYVNVMVNMSLITAGLYAVGVVTSGIFIGRLPIYTDVFTILLLPFILKHVLPKHTKGPVFVACVILYFVYFHLQMQDSGVYTTDLFGGIMDRNADIPYLH
ncbi:MAG: EpsG family protein [Clostridia bacterium]|nr:EpsG family protein [Clostridia bacterium]